ncbi:MAG: GNAT family N-acetyltransferase [Chloroflexota bacterium]
MNAYELPPEPDLDAVFNSFPQLETQRFILRAIEPSDAPALLAIFSDEAVTRYYDLYTYSTEEEAEALIDFFADCFEEERGIRWGIARKEDNLLLGTCGYVWLRRFRGEIGYELGRAYWRQGIMQEAIQAIVEFGYEKLGLNRIEALVMFENQASAELLKKLNFCEEGLLRQHDYFKDAFHDMRLFARLRSDGV